MNAGNPFLQGSNYARIFVKQFTEAAASFK